MSLPLLRLGFGGVGVIGPCAIGLWIPTLNGSLRSGSTTIGNLLRSRAMCASMLYSMLWTVDRDLLPPSVQSRHESTLRGLWSACLHQPQQADQDPGDLLWMQHQERSWGIVCNCYRLVIQLPYVSKHTLSRSGDPPLHRGHLAGDRMMTKTETLRRLRIAAQMAKKADWIPSNFRVEVGTRFKPVAITGRVPAQDEAFDPEDDLDNYWGLSESTKFMPDQIRQPGYIAHLYIAAPDNGWSGGELVNVIAVWLGDENHEPQLLHVPGKRQEVLDRINAEVRS